MSDDDITRMVATLLGVARELSSFPAVNKVQVKRIQTIQNQIMQTTRSLESEWRREHAAD